MIMASFWDTFFSVIFFLVWVFVVVLAEDNGRMSFLEFRDERVETDIKFLKFGAEIDLNYNETAEYPGQIISSPGCPKSHEGRPWIYYGSPPKCFLVGFHGPCSHGQRIFSVARSKYGVCNCDCFAQEIKISRGTPQNLHQQIRDYSKHDLSQNLVLYPRRARSQHQSSSNSGHNILARMITSASWNSNSPKLCNVTVVKSQVAASAEEQEDIPGISSYFLGKPASFHRVDNNQDKDRYSFCYSQWYKRQVVYDSLRQSCNPFLDQGPCQKGEWLVRDLSVENGVTCEKRKCPEVEGISVKPEHGGTYTFFDYRRQACYTEVYGNLQESFFANANGFGNNLRFCRDAGLRYSQRLKTCVRDLSKELQYKVIG